MAKGVNIVISIVDKVTAPIEKVTKSMKKAVEASSKMQAALESLEKHAKRLELGKVASFGAELLSGAAGFAKAAVSYTADTLLTADNARKSFALLMGSAEGGKKAFDATLQFAEKLNIPNEDALGSMQDLLRAGYNFKEATALFLAGASFKNFKPGAEMKPMMEAFTEIHGKGIMAVGDINKFKIGEDKVFAELAASRHITGSAKEVSAKIKALFDTGKITADEGVAAVAKAMGKLGGDKGGIIGSGAMKDADSVSKLWGKIKELPQTYLMKLTMDGGPAQKAMKQFLEMMNPASESGRKIMATLEGVGAKMAGMLIEFSKPENIEKFVKLITDMISSLPALIGFLIGMGKAVAWLVGVFLTTKENAIFLWKELVKLWNSCEPLRVVVGLIVLQFQLLAAIIWAPIAGVIWLYKKITECETAMTIFKVVLIALAAPFIALAAPIIVIVGLISKFWGLLEGAADKCKAWGKSMIDGLVAGVEGGTVRLENSMKNVVKLAENAVKTEAKIKSPSRLFFGHGTMITEGLRLGIAEGMADIPEAIGRPIAEVRLPAPGSGTSGASGAGGGRGRVDVGGITITINGAGKDAPAVAQAVREELRAYFAELN